MRRLIIAALISCPGLAQAQAFEAALQTELEALGAEKVALTRELEQTEAGTRAAETSLRTQIEDLTRALTEAQADNAARAERLTDAERAHSLEDQARRVAQVSDQIEAWMQTRGVTSATDAPLDDKIRGALDLVKDKSSLHRRTEEFFGSNGRAQRGEVVHIAQVAAIVEAASPIPLIRLDDGALRSVEGLGAPQDAGADGRVVSVVLYDPLETQAPSSYAEEGWLDYMRRGGAVMWPLALLGLIGLLVFLERAVALSRAGAKIRAFERQPRTPDASDALLAPIRVVMQRSGPLEDVEGLASDGLLRTEAMLRRGVSFLGIVAAVSPLIGLLGTVTGMIRTFSVITEHGTGDPRLLSAGISEALLTTQLGLAVAVPALLLHTGLLRWSQQILQRIEERCVEAMAARREAARGE